MQTTAEIQTELERLEAQRADWDQKRLTAQETAQRLEESSGTIALDQPSQLDDHLSKVDHAQALQRTATRALEALEGRKQTAERDLLLAEAQEIRASAAPILQEAQKLQQTVDSLLLQLQELDGVAYAVAQLDTGRMSTTGVQYTIPITKTQQFYAQAEALEQAARAKEFEVLGEASGWGRIVNHYSLDAGQLYRFVPLVPPLEIAAPLEELPAPSVLRRPRILHRVQEHAELLTMEPLT